MSGNHELSDVTGFSVDNAAGVLTDISVSVTNVTFNGGNGLVQNTGLGDNNHTEQRDIGIVKSMSIAGMINGTTGGIFEPIVAAGTSVTKTVQALLRSGQYISGEANIGPTDMNIPVGLKTFSAEFRSTSGDGWDYTSVAL